MLGQTAPDIHVRHRQVAGEEVSKADGNLEGSRECGSAFIEGFRRNNRGSGAKRIDGAAQLWLSAGSADFRECRGLPSHRGPIGRVPLHVGYDMLRSRRGTSLLLRGRWADKNAAAPAVTPSGRSIQADAEAKEQTMQKTQLELRFFYFAR